MKNWIIILTLLCFIGSSLSVKHHKKKKIVSKLKAQTKSNKKTLNLINWKDLSEGAIERCAMKINDYSRCRRHIMRMRKFKIEGDISIMAAEYDTICKYSKKLCRRLKREISRKMNCPTCKCGEYCQMRKNCIADCPPLSFLHQRHCAIRCQDCVQKTKICLEKHNENEEVCKLRCPTCEKCKTAIYKERESCKRVCNEKSRLIRLQHRVKKQRYIMTSLCKKCIEDVDCRPNRDCRFCRRCDRFTNRLARTAKNLLFEKMRQMKNFCISKCGKCGSLSLKTGKIIKCKKECFEECKGVRLMPGVVLEFARKYEKEFGLEGIVIDDRIRKLVDVDLARFEELRKKQDEVK